MIGRFVKDGLIYTLAGILTRGLAILLLPLYTRILSPADYGALDLILAFGTLVHLTVACEIAQGLAMCYSDKPDAARKTGYASTSFWFTFGMYSLFLIVAWLVSPWLAELVTGKDHLIAVFRIALIAIWANGLFNLLQNQFRWDLRSVAYARASVLVAAVATIITILLTCVWHDGLAGILMGMVMGALAGIIYAIPRLKPFLGFHFNVTRLREMLRLSLPLVPSGVAVFIAYYIDRLMIRHFLSLDDVGIYGVAFRLASISGLVMVGFQSALTPLILAQHRDPQTPGHIATIFRIFLSLALLLFLGLSLFAKEILWIMTVPAYYSAAPIVAFLAPAILLSNMYIFAPGTTIAKKTYFILAINVAGAVLNVGLNLFMIPLFGIIGACLATLINYACVFTAYMIFSQRLYYVPHRWTLLGSSVLAVVFLAVLGAQLHLATWIDILLKGLIMIVAMYSLIVMQLVTRAEIKQAKDTIMAKLMKRPQVAL